MERIITEKNINTGLLQVLTSAQGNYTLKLNNKILAEIEGDDTPRINQLLDFLNGI